MLETLSALSCFTTISDPSWGWRVSFWFKLAQMRCSVDRTEQGLQWSFASWPPQAVTEPWVGELPSGYLIKQAEGAAS